MQGKSFLLFIHCFQEALLIYILCKFLKYPISNNKNKFHNHSNKNIILSKYYVNFGGCNIFVFSIFCDYPASKFTTMSKQ